MKKKILAGLATVLAFGIGQAQATTFDLNLTGTVGSASTLGLFAWELPLNGFQPITIQSGDVVNATVILDQSLTISLSQPAIISLELDPGYLVFVVTSNQYTTTFYNQDLLIASISGMGFTFGGLTLDIADIPPSITFDKVISNSTITQVGDNDSLDLNEANLVAFTFTSNVPEPASLFLLGSGLAGLAGLNMRRKK